ncbi:MAG: hypothetical protein EZS28_047723 [Streblomastix strix]|uniref:Uncharacterized protein n=1 Tax=Streblomastix strix TaxID=222440 RepID=A0A5J4TGD7_9EUKA|nr:MAG: hypothetical protein EZS28_047723 [Streblomastix strix]
MILSKLLCFLSCLFSLTLFIKFCIVDTSCEAEYDMELIEQLLDQRELEQLQELQALYEGINPHADEEEERERLAALELQLKKQAETEAERKLNEEKEFTDTIIKALTEALARHCPNCHRAIVKEIGCNHILCPCGEHFCYVCEQSTAGVMYGHFNKGSNPCPLFLDNNAKFNKERQRKQAGEKAQQFAQDHPGFEDVDRKLKSILDERIADDHISEGVSLYQNRINQNFKYSILY